MNCGKHSRFGGKIAFLTVMTILDKIDLKILFMDNNS